MFCPLFRQSEVSPHWHSGSSPELFFLQSLSQLLRHARCSHDSREAERRHQPIRKQRRKVCTVARLEVLTCERAQQRKCARLHSDDIGLSRQGADKVQEAEVITAWESAVGRVSTQRQQDAEQRAAGLPAEHGKRAWSQDKRSVPQNCLQNRSLRGATLKWTTANSSRSRPASRRSPHKPTTTPKRTSCERAARQSSGYDGLRCLPRRGNFVANTACWRSTGVCSARGTPLSGPWVTTKPCCAAMWVAGRTGCRATSRDSLRRGGDRPFLAGGALAAVFATGRRSDELRTRYLITPLALDNRPAEERTQKQGRNSHATSRRRNRGLKEKVPSSEQPRGRWKRARRG